MNTSVYQETMVSCVYLLVMMNCWQKTTTQKLCLCLFIYLRFYRVQKKKIKNVADLVAACRVVLTLL